MSGAGLGFGKDVIYDSSYRQIATVNGANGFPADLHEFLITAQNTALITTYQPVYWDASGVPGGKKREIVVDSVVQEIDIPTGLVLFQWDSLDHVAVTDSYVRPPPARTSDPFDYFHVNSVDVDRDGNLIVSGRNTWTIYKVDRHTGAVIWRLGGAHSSFKLAPRTYWAFQHDVRVQAHNDLYITLFDNESGVYGVRRQSGAVKLRLDLKHMTATQVHRDSHSPPTLAPFAGDVEQLPDHNNFVGWGARPYISEYSPSGRLLYDAHFVGANASYRAYLLPWAGQPDPAVFPPNLAVTPSRHGLVVYASWNGATDVSSWRCSAALPRRRCIPWRRRAAPGSRRRSQLGGTRTWPCRRSTPAGTCSGSRRRRLGRRERDAEPMGYLCNGSWSQPTPRVQLLGESSGVKQQVSTDPLGSVQRQIALREAECTLYGHI